jgi:ubiquitin C-terminal hydrolase
MNSHASRPNLRELTEAEEEVKERMPDLKVSSIEWARYVHRNKSVIVDLFQGQLQSRLRCLTCGHQSTTYNAFTSLSLPIPKQPNLSLRTCLDEFVKSESMEGEDSWHCAKCKSLRKATKRLAISKLPDVLLIHFKRFETKGPWRDKINVDISFPLNALDMTEYLRHLGGTIVPAVYDLFGIVYHRGSMEGGHYTAMVSADPTNDWTLFDDSRVAPSDQIDGRAAYILFYQKRSQAI